MKSRHVIASIDGMVAILVNLISKGYRYYFTGTIDDAAKQFIRDSRMLEYYEADLPKWTRERRRRRGEANFRYLRFDDWFIVLATEGKAEWFWHEDRQRTRDVRNVPIRFKGYSISYRQGGWKDRKLWADPLVRERDMKWHVRVQLDAETYAGLKAYFLNIATHRQADFLAHEFLDLPFQPYRPVREQLLSILRAVNRLRQQAGYHRIPYSAIRYKRRVVNAFVPQHAIRVDGLTSTEGNSPAVRASVVANESCYLRESDGDDFCWELELKSRPSGRLLTRRGTLR